MQYLLCILICISTDYKILYIKWRIVWNSKVKKKSSRCQEKFREKKKDSLAEKEELGKLYTWYKEEYDTKAEAFKNDINLEW